MVSKVDQTKFIARIKELKGLKKDVMTKAIDYYKQVTPIRGGNARNKTILDSADKIEANYPYAGKLDSGWSKQAPDGMTKPTTKYMKTLVQQYVNKVKAKR